MQNGHLIEASTLKISAFLNNLILGRGFGSVFRHHIQGLGSFPGPLSFWRRRICARVAASKKKKSARV